MPCEIKLGGRTLESFLAAPYQLNSPDADLLHVATLRGQFGAVDRLPKIFNESDSHAEALNLKSALLTACQTINPSQMSMHLGGFKEAHKIAFATWLSQADGAFVGALARNRELRDAASERSYERLYREVKISVLEYYQRFTASELPLIGAGGALAYFDDFMQARTG
jgi:hypothetical protein